jgi:hypothetical protein
MCQPLLTVSTSPQIGGVSDFFLKICCSFNRKEIYGCAPQSMVSSNKAEIDVKNHHAKRFQVIDEFLGKAACPSKRPPGTAPQPAVVPFYSHRIVLLLVK